MRASGDDSTAALEEDGRWDAPGHNSVVTDAGGRDWLLYHAIDREERFGPQENLMRKMLLDPLGWVDGWPTVEGGVTSEGSRAGPMAP